ncbi:AraC family transcriptional regulator [Cohnella thermotolerans]|jgi:AraC-like DNA-binding protein|uniref:AraC family transcriptional regulator n=1 Tax=Cohnella thermotolerans TaxID=329858 RepID=UPI00047DB340|nr:AraC family transcriptional regulator [Cohnella thermotolerans]
MAMTTFREEIRIRLLYAGKVSETPNWNFPSHKHDDLHEILAVCDGKGVFTIGGTTYSVGKGDILVYNKGVLHEEHSSSESPLLMYYCGFSFPSVVHSSDDWVIPPDQEPVIRSSRFFSEIAALMKMLFDEASVKEEGHEIISHYLLNSILILIRRTLQSQNHIKDQESNSLAVHIKDYIDKNFTQNISLKELGKQFHVNPYYISHVFKGKYNISPINYSIHRRIGEATKLLVSTEMKVWEIAKILGYDNPNYFSIMFKKITGQSPNQFRESNQRNLYLQ